MKNKGLKEMVLLTLALGLVAGLARAQMPVTLVADIPFSFTVERTTLPAGKYEVQQMSDEPWEWTIADAKGTVKVIVSTEPAETMNPPKLDELQFNVYNGKEHFLSRVWIQGDTDGYYITKSAAERKLLKKGTGKVHRVPLSKKAM
jgi:hypothetical protein